MNIKTKICVQKWQLEHHNVSKLLLLLPKSSTSCGKNCQNAKFPKLHSKFCGRNLETRELPNLRKYHIVDICTVNHVKG